MLQQDIVTLLHKLLGQEGTLERHTDSSCSWWCVPWWDTCCHQDCLKVLFQCLLNGFTHSRFTHWLTHFVYMMIPGDLEALFWKALHDYLSTTLWAIFILKSFHLHTVSGKKYLTSFTIFFSKTTPQWREEQISGEGNSLLLDLFSFYFPFTRAKIAAGLKCFEALHSLCTSCLWNRKKDWS